MFPLFTPSFPLFLLLLRHCQTHEFHGYSHENKGDKPVELQLKLGTIEGTESHFDETRRVQSFLGVPFAEPPVGKNRFRVPKVKQPWEGTLQTKTLAPACYQPRDTFNETFWGSEMWNANTPTSEDCLYLNIWAPANASNLTVMVWIFGGGYYYGSPSLVLYDGRALAAVGNVVVVNINYRVGPFGYLYLGTDDAPGNMGMLDQQIALYWIRDNIFNFGGNSKRITLFGESAGASSIVAHLIAPGSKDLFTNGILQSGSLDNKWAMDSPQRALQKSLKLAELVNCSRIELSETAECLREANPDDLIAQLWNVGLNFLEFPFVVVSQDKYFFKDKDGFKALREADFSTDANVMIGINHDEGNFWNIYNLPDYFNTPEQPILTKAAFNNSVNTAFAQHYETIRYAAQYVYDCEHKPKNISDYEYGKFLAEQVNQMVGDFFFTCDSLWLADKLTEKNKTRSGKKVFVYYFSQTSSANPWPKWTGVMHGYEIEFVFGVPLYNKTAPYTEREKTFSRRIVEFWTSFSTNGVPTLKGKPELIWPAYDGEKNRRWMKLIGGSHSEDGSGISATDNIQPIAAIKKEECSVWRFAKDLEYKDYLAYSPKSCSLLRSSLPLPLLFLLLTLY